MAVCHATEENWECTHNVSVLKGKTKSRFSHNFICTVAPWCLIIMVPKLLSDNRSLWYS